MRITRLLNRIKKEKIKNNNTEKINMKINYALI